MIYMIKIKINNWIITFRNICYIWVFIYLNILKKNKKETKEYNLMDYINFVVPTELLVSIIILCKLKLEIFTIDYKLI